MITIQNGKLHIPDEDRFVGFAGDNAAMQKQFFLLNRVRDNCNYTLCLRFDDGTVRTAPLSAIVENTDTVLTWEIQNEQLYTSGVATVQLKALDSDGSVMHSTKDFFLIGSSVELDEDGLEAEYVTPSQLRNSINQAVSEIAATAPYVDEDGYWCVYDPHRGAYHRTDYHVGGIAPDSAMSDDSDNTVGNRTIKRYVDGKAMDCNTFATAYTDTKTADKVPNTRKIAQLPLTDDITQWDLMNVLRPLSYRTNITPNSSGIRGQLGIGPVGEVFFCTEDNTWAHLAEYEDLYEKMDLISEIIPGDVDEMPDGSLFFVGGALYVKYDDEAVALTTANDVYTKTEINSMIGDVEGLLAAI